MLNNPWDRPNADDPAPRVISLHRGAFRPAQLEQMIRERGKAERPDLFERLRSAWQGDEQNSPARRPVLSDFDRDLQIIGFGLAAAALWVCVFRLAQMFGAVS